MGRQIDIVYLLTCKEVNWVLKKLKERSSIAWASLFAYCMKCAKCHKLIVPVSSAVSYRSKSYCSECFASLKDKASQKNQKTAGQMNDPAFLALSEYLCGVFRLEGLTPLLQKQLTEFHEEKGWTWESIHKAARYFFSLSNPQGEQPVTLGILPFIYDEAMDYYRTVSTAEEYNRSVYLENRTR